MQTIEATTLPAGAPVQSVPVTLDLLTRMRTEELKALYAKGRVPDSLAVLDGTPRGRMLAVAGPPDRGLTSDLIRAFAGGRVFPWDGKSFQSETASTGRGINRVIVAGDLFPFSTFVGPSEVDGAPAVILDYDKPQNPALIRMVHDEIREVAPGLFMGPAMRKTKGRPALVLHFAIDATDRAAGARA